MSVIEDFCEWFKATNTNEQPQDTRDTIEKFRDFVESLNPVAQENLPDIIARNALDTLGDGLFVHDSGTVFKMGPFK